MNGTFANLTASILNSTNTSLPALSSIKDYYFPQSILAFLHKPLITLFGIALDYWSILHFLAGYLLGMLILRLLGTMFSRGSYYVAGLVILTIFEAFEYFLVKNSLALPERLADTISDIIIGMLGIFIADIGMIALIIVITLILYIAWRYS